MSLEKTGMCILRVLSLATSANVPGSSSLSKAYSMVKLNGASLVKISRSSSLMPGTVIGGCWYINTSLVNCWHPFPSIPILYGMP